MKTAIAPGDTWTDSEVRVAVAIDEHGSKENPISRSELCAHVGLNDRTVRTIKRNLITKHNIRIETSKHGGYYIPEEGDTVTAADREYGRAKSCFVTAALLRGLTPAEAAGEIQQAFALTTKEKSDG